MKLVSLLAAMAGLALIGILVGYFGADAVIRSLLAVGWAGFVTICLIHLALMAVMGIAWWALLPGTSIWPPIWGRLVRDSGSEVLPLSQVGGYLLGARAIAFAGVPGAAAAASTIVDVSVEFVSQIAFTGLALGWLIWLRPGAPVAIPVGIGLAAAGILAVGLVVAQRRGFALIDRLAGTLGRDWLESTAASAAALHAAITAIYGRRIRLFASFVIHLVCWVAATTEAWLALRFAGAPLDFGVVLVIEGLLYAARSVAFAVPNAVGVQEGAYILLGGSFGLTPDMALALSLLKRARDLALGLPVLATCQILEGRRLWRRVPVLEWR
ncbi:MAG: flippase-like domain-containing protein [Alphaproteobacteria bacterium]|nr:flippase-like domain-containing protein [Alphaproteobacteria bacterium]